MSDGDGDEGAPRSEPTGVVPMVPVRLADFLGGQPPLPCLLLLVVSGPARGETLAVVDLPAVIGRSSGADLVIDDDTVSRRHAEFRGNRGAVEVEDLGSSNGTTLNGNPITGSLLLRDGDLLGLGSATFLVKRVA